MQASRLTAIGGVLLAAARERGPGWTAGVALLIAALGVAETGGHATLMGWPLVFLIAGAVVSVAGMAQPKRT